jgi:hypothetical protein
MKMFKLVASQDVEVMISFRGRKIPKTETKYTYESNDGAKLTFMADHKKAFTYTLYNDESNDKGISLSKDIIEFHIAQ